MSKKLDKVPFRFYADKKYQEYIVLEDGGSNGYKGKWWEKIPNSRELGTTKNKVRYSHEKE
tara:strand:- start:693 stop:875 length:183 start_codon:yes stop_codon:yes gene_type:complete